MGDASKETGRIAASLVETFEAIGTGRLKMAAAAEVMAGEGRTGLCSVALAGVCELLPCQAESAATGEDAGAEE
jgi:hypothetical protein